jgi:hypothetical protein
MMKINPAERGKQQTVEQPMRILSVWSCQIGAGKAIKGKRLKEKFPGNSVWPNRTRHKTLPERGYFIC